MRKLVAAVLMALALTALVAQAPSPLDALIANVKSEYSVVKGDTLKGIAAQQYGDYRLWPIVWFGNRSAVQDPERIEVGDKVAIFALPFKGGEYSDVEKAVIKQAYLRAYQRYVENGASLVDERRWVLLESQAFGTEILEADRRAFTEEDRQWYAAKMGVSAQPAETTIVILHTNDTHARGLETKTEIGYSRIAGYAKTLKEQGQNVLLLDAGDTFHGMPWANLEKGMPVVQLMNAAGYDVMTTGNHDYNYGYSQLQELIGWTDFPVVAANVYKDGKRVFEPYFLKDMDGIRVAIFGLASPETSYKADPAGIQGLEFRDPVEEAKKLVRGELAGQYDLLICLAHVGLDASSNPTSERIAEAVPEIDVLIDGHSHTSLAAAKAENQTPVLIASADSYGLSLGRVEVVLNRDRKVIRKSAVSLNLKENAAELVSDPEVKAMADAIVSAQAPMLAEVVGKTLIPLEGKREIVRTSETNLGRLIALGMLVTTGADIALMNGGGIRDSIPAGDVTKKHVYTVLPFGNYIWTTTVKGSELDAILENGVSKLPAADGRFPHLAGWSYTLDVTKPAGDRVSDIKVRGQPVDPEKTYTLATLNFLMSGGDEYVMLKGKTYKEFPIDADSFMNILKVAGIVSDATLNVQASIPVFTK